jgi:hypothetical protein
MQKQSISYEQHLVEDLTKEARFTTLNARRNTDVPG